MPEETAQRCATQVLDTLHLMIRTIGPEMRKRSPGGLSMHQFRAMCELKLNEGASLSEIAENLGATISSASKMIDGLVERGLITRETDPEDRRRLALAVTEAGERAMESVHLYEHDCMAEILSSLSANECAMIELAMTLLRSAFVQLPVSESQR